MMTNAKLVGVYHEDDPSDEDGSPVGSDRSGSGAKSSHKKCLARRQVPLTVEPGLTMIMALDESCLACGSGNRLGNGSVTSTANYTSERESFLRKYDSLGKDELSAAFMVPFEDLLNLMGTEIPCVGCRRSVESLLQKLFETCESESLEPLVITEDALVSVSRNHIYGPPNALANLFVDQVAKLEAVIQSQWGTGGFSGSKKSSKVGGRCAAHSLGLLSNCKRGGAAGATLGMSGGHWLDTWECMERECQEEVVLIHFDLLRETLDRYLKKHSFCSECTHMVNKAYSLLVDDGACPAALESIEDVTECSGGSGDNHCHANNPLPLPPNQHPTNGSSKAGSRSSSSSSDTLSLSSTEGTSTALATTSGKKKKSGDLYKGITACPADQHVHVECSPAFVSKLITMAEPELSGLKQERHAKTIEIAQKEVLTCIGICLYDRFQRIQQRLREGQQACDLLFLIALKSLKKSFEMAFESKQGISDLEKFCLELDEEDRRKKEKAQKKRDKKSKQKLNRSNRKEKLETSFCNSKDVIPTSQVPIAPSPTARANPNKAVKAADKDVKAEYPAGENDAKIFPPPAKPSPPSQKNGLNNHKSSSSKPLAVTKGKAPVIKSTLPVNEFPSLESMLILDGDGGGSEGSVGGGCGGGLHDFNEEDVEGGENLIPLEDIRAFQARLPVVAQQSESNYTKIHTASQPLENRFAGRV